MISNEAKLRELIKQVNPDIIIVDNYVYSPSLHILNIPWVRVVSCNPLFVLNDPRTPPGTSGLPTGLNHYEEWESFRAAKRQIYRPLWEKVNDWIGRETNRIGEMCLPENVLHPNSPWANIYMMPTEVDYLDCRELPDKWHRFDGLVREESDEDGKFELPESMSRARQNGEKLVYLSMGTLGCADVQLMQRLVNILKDSKHKFIVSKGPLGEKYELAENMWGEKSLPQTKIIPLVDLVITHGGNNTFNEILYFGKPMIVMPLFGDQFDNGQRVEEKGLGVRLDTYYCNKNQLLTAIDKLLNDNELAARLAVISQQIAASKGREKVADLIESLI